MYIVVVDRSPHIASLIQKTLAEQGYESTLWPRDRDIVPEARAVDPHFVLVDLSPASAGDSEDPWRELDDDPTLHALPRVLCVPDVDCLGRHMADLHAKGCLVLPRPFQVSALVRLLAALDTAARARVADERARPLSTVGSRATRGGGWLTQWLTRWWTAAVNV